MEKEREKDETLTSNFDNLYQTVNQIYNTKKPVSRVLYITKMKEFQGKEEKVVRETTILNVRDEIKRLLKKSGDPFNLMIVYIGHLYAFVAIEDTNENLLNYLNCLNEEIETKSPNSCHMNVHIIAFVEECPVSFFPVYYKYEGSVYDKESQQYKDKPVIEKGWVLYENLFCNLGRTIKPLIQNEADFVKNEARIKKEEGAFAKYIPSMDEIYEFTGPDYISLKKFVEMYMDTIDIELDEDLIWPYQWPMNI